LVSRRHEPLSRAGPVDVTANDHGRHDFLDCARRICDTIVPATEIKGKSLEPTISGVPAIVGS